jgi:hypothetical protein
MMMKMLEEGGIPPLTDNIREADVDNPKGYYEFERVKKLPEDTAWLPDAVDKAVKILAELVMHLPDDYRYKIIFIERNMEEIMRSQDKMLERRGEDPKTIPHDKLAELFRGYAKKMKDWCETQGNVKVLYVQYNDILDRPKRNIMKIIDFLGGDMDREKMLAVVDAKLYRNRAK